MARIYTRTGDGGDTALGDGSRRRKSDPRIELYGEIDELNSVLGCCVAALGDPATATLADDLRGLQARLFDLGAVLADPLRSAETAALPPGQQPFDPAFLEGSIDEMEKGLAPLKNFILPGGAPAAAWLHLARTVCRRAERRAVALAAADPVPAGALVLLNRISDYLFVAARAANAAAGIADVPWTPKGSV